MRQFVALVASFVLLGTTLWGIITYLRHRWLELGAAVVTGLATLIGMLYMLKLVIEQTNVNPEMVRRKTEGSSAFDASLRLNAFAKTPELARIRLGSLVKAYSQFNLASGNALVGRLAEFDPRGITFPRWSWWQEWLGRGMRLTVAKIASMWHLPTDAAEVLREMGTLDQEQRRMRAFDPKNRVIECMTVYQGKRPFNGCPRL